MRAAVVLEAGQPPVLSDFAEPSPSPSETLLSMSAAAVNPLTISRAAGVHYSASTRPPFVVGTDGVGRTKDGTRVYVAGAPRAPFGTFAERVPAANSRLIRVPETLPDTLAAAIAIPGLASWNPLTHRVKILPGESVLVHGGTGAAGHMAIQIARHLGARAVVATGRNRTKLAALEARGVDRVIPLDQPTDDLRTAVRDAVREFQVGVILDFLWGATAAAVIAGAGGPNGPRGSALIRYVQIGAIAGPSLSLDSAILRSSGLEILGSGLGSSSDPIIDESLDALFRAAVTAGFRLDIDVHPLSDFANHWGSTGEDRRLVFSFE
jgi:NADPH:quinone reductase-like Zn-dependent oxidoreductase